MTYRGLLGFRRLTNRGPLTFEQTGTTTLDEIEEMVVDIIEEEDIDPDNPTEEELNQVANELSRVMFPDDDDTVITPIGNQPKAFAFQICMGSSWVEDWETGFRDVTTGLASEFESLIVKANGCEGIVESEDILATQLIMSEEDCKICDMVPMG